jgi:class 3 adenylate cyclase
VSAFRVVSFAEDVMQHASSVLMPHNGLPTEIRIGIHTGPVVSGLIGHSLPKFGLFGDTMNVASRMEHTAPPGCVQISDATRLLLGDELPAGMDFVPTGGVDIKGKGVMQTHLWRLSSSST